MLLVAPDGREIVRHRWRDVADRPDDTDVLEALRGLALTALAPVEPWAPDDLTPQPSDGGFRPTAFGPCVPTACRSPAGRCRSTEPTP